jgi:hypothetical protein
MIIIITNYNYTSCTTAVAAVGAAAYADDEQDEQQRGIQSPHDSLQVYRK